MTVLDNIYDELIQIVSEVGAQVDVPIESEKFFSDIISKFEGSKEECRRARGTISTAAARRPMHCSEGYMHVFQ